MTAATLSILAATGGLSPALADEARLSGGLDARASTGTPGGEVEVEAFVNLRVVHADDQGDRLIGVVQADLVAPEWDESHLYQAYAEYKGPLGRWNVRGGRFILPYGLLARYDSERYLLRTSEALVLGLKLDEGAEAHGILGEWDWAVAVTEGVGRDAVGTARVGREWESGLVLGLSALAGRLPRRATDASAAIGERLAGEPLQRKRRIGLDAERAFGPLLLRAEIDAGTDDGDGAAGGFVGAEYAFNQDWEVATSYGLWTGFPHRARWGATITRRLAGTTARVAAGYIHHEEENDDEDMATVQIYWDFSRGL